MGGSIFFIGPGSHSKSAYCKQIAGVGIILQQHGVRVVTTNNQIHSSYFLDPRSGVLNVPRGVDPYFSDAAPEYFEEGNYDLVITLLDTYNLSWLLEEENKELLKKTLVYAPVDFPVNDAALEVNPILLEAPYVAVPSKWGYRQLSRARGRKPTFYIPHGIGVEYRPVVSAKPNFRRSIGLPEDAFIVGSVGVNLGERKNLPGVIEAFSILAEKNPNAYLYIQTDPSPYDGKYPKSYEGLKYDLPRIARRHGVQEKVLYPEDSDYRKGLPEAKMAWLYSAFDVYLSMSYAEASCLPLYEAQGSGTPIVVADNTAQTETVSPERGWLVPMLPGKYTPLGRPEHQQYNPVDIKRAGTLLIKAWRHRDTTEEFGRAGAEWASQFRFDRVVKKYWLPLLNKLGVEFQMSEDVDLESSDARLHAVSVRPSSGDESYLEEAKL